MNTSYSARFSPSLKEVVVCYCGIQARVPDRIFNTAVELLHSSLEGAEKPIHWDRARYRDTSGFTNEVFALYWSSYAAFDRWYETPQNRRWWEGRLHADDGVGCFLELAVSPCEAFETIFSHRREHGAAHIGESMSGEVLEHGYWGSSRDRMAISDFDTLAPSGVLRAVVNPTLNGRQIRVLPHANLCIIRSGQDWSLTSNDERELYLTQLRPPLTAGMKFLAEEGRSIGCYYNRYMDGVGGAGQALQSTYSVSVWKSLSHLEKWAEFHPTHLSIFHSAIRYYKGLGESANLQLYHEVSIVDCNRSFFDYIGCHAQTGMLAAF